LPAQPEAKADGGPQCANCFFMRMRGTVYECHHNSPIALESTGGGQSATTNWPDVQATDWCGDGWDPNNGLYRPDQVK
jgi:hypothetical protein